MKISPQSLLTFNAIVSVGAFAPVKNTMPHASGSATPRSSSAGVPAKTALNGWLLNRAAEIWADGKFVENADLSMETKLYLGEVNCAITQFASSQAQVFIDGVNEGGVGNHTSLKTEKLDLGWKKSKIGGKWKKTKVATRTHEICDGWTTNILTEVDLVDEHDSFIQQELKQGVYSLKKGVVRSDKIFEIDDYDLTFADAAEQSGRVMADLKYVQGQAFPQSYNTDFNMQTDESFSRIFFHGIAAPIMAISDEVTDPEHLKYGPYMVDMGFMSELSVRPGDLYKKYGARIHFDENQMVSAIYDCDEEKLFLPGDDGWEAAKMQAKVAAFTLGTVREHLSQTHLIVSNNASYEIVMNLHPEHPIRRLLAIFTYNAVDINANAFEVLVPERSFIHRATPLDFEGVQGVFKNAYTTSIAYQPFPDREIKNPKLKELAYPEEGELSGFPYLSEGCEFYNITRNMVREWLDEAGDEASDEYALAFYEAMKKNSEGQLYELPEYSHDNMVDLISTIAFTVTAYHELIGHVPDYTDLTNKAGFRIAKSDPTQVDIQSLLITSVISAGTSAPAPQLMAEFPNFIAAGGAPEWEKDVWTRFIAKMGLQSKKVQEDERKRAFEFKYFDPSLFECSVSV